MSQELDNLVKIGQIKAEPGTRCTEAFSFSRCRPIKRRVGKGASAAVPRRAVPTRINAARGHGSRKALAFAHPTKNLRKTTNPFTFRFPAFAIACGDLSMRATKPGFTLR